MSQSIDEFETLYCPPLDTSTFHAIISDFDLSDEAGTQAAKAVLEALKESANADDTTDFDPSGNSNFRDDPSESASSLHSLSGHAETGSGQSPSVTDATSSLDAFTFQDSDTYDKGIDSMSGEEKKALLCEIFQELKPFDINFAFNKHGEDFGATVEELLNQHFLVEEAIANDGASAVPKGVDGFASVHGATRRKKGKSKGKNKAKNITLGQTGPLVEGPASSVNQWRKGQEDVHFITSRTQLSEKSVKSIYSSNGYSLKTTLVALCSKPLSDGLNYTTDADDASVQSNIVDLVTEHPTVSVAQATVIVLLTHPLYAHARDLAGILSFSPSEKLMPVYTPTKIPESERQQDSGDDTESSFLAAGAELPVGASHHALRSSAFAQASAAYRKARASPAMGGAAAYYASVGHAANAAMKRERSLEANARVAAQSRGGSEFCDLHGVTVQDATRIARQYVERWWSTRQEWAREGKAMTGAAGSSSYRVVVGRGNHNAEKKSRLGPAVAKMLRNYGWKIDEQIGEIVVRGRMRK